MIIPCYSTIITASSPKYSSKNEGANCAMRVQMKPILLRINWIYDEVFVNKNAEIINMKMLITFLMLTIFFVLKFSGFFLKVSIQTVRNNHIVRKHDRKRNTRNNNH